MGPEEPALTQERLSLSWPSNRGCQADAIRALAGTVPLWVLITYVGQQLGNKLADKLATAPAYQAALGRWRTCMAARGLSYDSPQHAKRSIADEYTKHGGTLKLQRREIVTAVADGKCALQAHVPATALASRREMAANLTEQERRNLVTLAVARSAAVQRAHAILDPH